MKGIKHECHDHAGGVRECGKVRQLSIGVTVLRYV